MRVKLLYFAWLREATGKAEEMMTVPDGVETIADLAAWLAQTHPAFADTSKLRVAIDQEMASMTSPIANAREIAFFPPVTGG